MLYNPGNREETLAQIKKEFKLRYNEEVELDDDRVWSLYLEHQNDPNADVLHEICWAEKQKNKAV